MHKNVTLLILDSMMISWITSCMILSKLSWATSLCMHDGFENGHMFMYDANENESFGAIENGHVLRHDAIENEIFFSK